MTDELERRMNAAVEAANRRIATCHERVACPRCHAPIGHRCRRMPRGYCVIFEQRGLLQPSQIVGPHRERWTLVQPSR